MIGRAPPPVGRSACCSIETEPIWVACRSTGFGTYNPPLMKGTTMNDDPKPPTPPCHPDDGCSCCWEVLR